MIYRFAEFELDTRLGTLAGPDGKISLRPQTCRLLEVLLDHAPDLLDSDELLDLAWGRRALSPNAVPQGISELRQALGDSAQSPRFIETRHRRGYRIICPVEKFESVPDAVQPLSSSGRKRSALRFRLLAGAAGITLLALAVVSVGWWRYEAERRWLEGNALPEIRELMEQNLFQAWQRLRQARDRVPGEPLLEQMWLDLTLPADLVSEPPGATVEVLDYRGDEASWVTLGQTPLQDVRLPLVQMRFRVSLDGYRTLEAAPSVLPAAEPFRLHRPNEAPAGMVHVPGGKVTYQGQTRTVPEFWLDRHEVTNRQYLAFIEAGGYQQPELWRHPVDENGRELSHGELMARLVDTTGMAGPATWALGIYPEGEDDHPVEGISWYEAAAFAEFAGKQLPTVFHWYRAAGLGTLPLANFSDVLHLSNFSGRGTTAVGTLGGLGPYGTLDMAGNVAEWTANPAGQLRHITGGSWLSNNYRFRDPNAHPPLERRPGFGVRLMKQDHPIDPELVGDIPISTPEVPDPVDEATFAIYERQFDYDPAPLHSRVEKRDDSRRDWHRERVSFTTAYGNERMAAQVFLPKRGQPPFQTVVHFPGGDALLLDDSAQAGLIQVELFLRSGRAVVYPVYAGTFERRDWVAAGPASRRDLLVAQVRDLRRTLDYLETREDIDGEAILLHALSYGGVRAPYALAVEDRFQAAIIVSAGILPQAGQPPEVQIQNYLPRVRLPVLLITGRDDFTFPLESSQKPFFELLGSPPEMKQHVVLDWGHIPPYDPELVRAHLDWADRWLGRPEAN